MNVRAMQVSLSPNSKSLTATNLSEIICLMASFAAIGAVLGWAAFNVAAGYDDKGGLVAGLLFLAIALSTHPKGQPRISTLLRDAPIGTKLIGGVGTSLAAFGGYVIPEGLFLGELDLVTFALLQIAAFLALYAIRPKKAS